MRRKGRVIAIAGAAVTGIGVLMVVPFAHAEVGDGPERLMMKCAGAEYIMGEQQQGDLNHPHVAESCDLVDKVFTEFDGPAIQISRRFRNCPPDLFEGGKAEISIEASLEQTGGKYEFTRVGPTASLGPFLSAEWQTFEGTRDLATKTIRSTIEASADVPENTIATFKFVPRMVRMNANWHVFTPYYDGFPSSTDGDRAPTDDEKVAEEVVGPKMLHSGLFDGTLVLDTSEPCPAK